MSNTYYDLYLSDVFKLAKTLVVKSHATAEAINTNLEQMQPNLYIDKQNLSTWKYYMNLAGDYHSTDTMMYVISMDTLEEIAFTKENLEIHRATAREYAYGSRYYNALVSKYPEQEMLIFGILNPVPLWKSTTAKDHQILYYDPVLVEENELSLISRLQEWIDGYFVRWYVSGYEIDDLFAAAALGVLFIHMPMAIINIRLAACKTNEAHSYHIRQYLASNGRLDVYMDYLTKKQALFLYRNIRYLHRNAGKQETFELLTSRILTERGIPLAEYTIRHNLAELPEKILPKIELLNHSINFDYVGDGIDVSTVGEILAKEIPEARDNAAVLAEAEVEITARMQNSLHTNLSTKVLESSVTDLTDSAPYTLADIMLNQWLYFSTNNRFPTILSITNPVSGEKMPLSAKDAFIVFLYAFNKARGTELITIPRIEATRVRRPILPTVAELKAVVNPKYVSDKIILHSLKNQPAIGMYISVEAFREVCEDIHAAMLLHRDLHAYREHQRTRGEVEAMIDCFYTDIECDIGAGQFYEAWFEERGLTVQEMSELDLDLLATEILKVATGANLNTKKSLKELQEALLRLQAQLSSYSIQYLRTINNSSIRIIDWPVIRVGDDKTNAGSKFWVDVAPIYVQRDDVKGKDRIKITLDTFGTQEKFNSRIIDSFKLDVSIDAISEAKTAHHAIGKIPHVWVRDMVFNPPGPLDADV